MQIHRPTGEGPLELSQPLPKGSEAPHGCRGWPTRPSWTATDSPARGNVNDVKTKVCSEVGGTKEAGTPDPERRWPADARALGVSRDPAGCRGEACLWTVGTWLCPAPGPPGTPVAPVLREACLCGAGRASPPAAQRRASVGPAPESSPPATGGPAGRRETSSTQGGSSRECQRQPGVRGRRPRLGLCIQAAGGRRDGPREGGWGCRGRFAPAAPQRLSSGPASGPL